MSKQNLEGIADLAGSVSAASAKKTVVERLDKEGATLDANGSSHAYVPKLPTMPISAAKTTFKARCNEFLIS